MSLKIERWPWQRMGLGRTKFDTDFCLKDEGDAFVPGTNNRVKRVRPVPLGQRARGFFADEIDGLIEGLRTLRDKAPFTPPRPAVPPKRSRLRARA